MGGWVGGQAEYCVVPYADFNLLKLSSSLNPSAQNDYDVKEKLLDFALLSDILPTGLF